MEHGDSELVITPKYYGKNRQQRGSEQQADCIKVYRDNGWRESGNGVWLVIYSSSSSSSCTCFKGFPFLFGGARSNKSSDQSSAKPTPHEEEAVSPIRTPRRALLSGSLLLACDPLFELMILLALSLMFFKDLCNKRIPVSKLAEPKEIQDDLHSQTRSTLSLVCSRTCSHVPGKKRSLTWIQNVLKNWSIIYLRENLLEPGVHSLLM